MARLSKADWNKLKKVMAGTKGTLLAGTEALRTKGVRWKTGRPVGRPKQIKEKP